MQTSIQAPARTGVHAPALPRNLIVGTVAFLTLVDLFATQAILPWLAARYGVGAAAMGVAVNAGTLGMAIAGLAVALFGRRIERRRGIAASLAALAVPTALLAAAPDLATFALLRIAQGVFMAAAFTLTLAYLAENGGPGGAAAAVAAYVTGNVASNLLGRLMSAALADRLGIEGNFIAFALLNLAGAVLVCVALAPVPRPAVLRPSRAPGGSWRAHLADPALRAAFGIGFCILFAFIDTFTYVNFVLARAPFSIGMMTLGLVYFVFLPSIVTTPLAGRAVALLGVRGALWGALALAGLGLPMLLAAELWVLLGGLVLVAVGTFLAQAVATGFVGRAAGSDRAGASGIYLACYFLGGIVGSAVLGAAYDRWGWTACVGGIGVALAVAAGLARRLTSSSSSGSCYYNSNF